MGMMGMTTEAAAAYAAAGNTSKGCAAEKPARQLTVAEARNSLNYVSHYYDNWSFDDFWANSGLPAKQKLAVLFGEQCASLVDDTSFTDLLNNIK